MAIFRRQALAFVAGLAGGGALALEGDWEIVLDTEEARFGGVGRNAILERGGVRRVGAGGAVLRRRS